MTQPQLIGVTKGVHFQNGPGHQHMITEARLTAGPSRSVISRVIRPSASDSSSSATRCARPTAVTACRRACSTETSSTPPITPS